MVTIVLLVSRNDYLEKVLTGLELMRCDADKTNILCIVDGDDSLFLSTRNHVNGMKFNQRLVVRAEVGELPSRLDIQSRRKHIAALHNQAGKLISPETEWVFSVEDDTTFGRDALEKLLPATRDYPAIGFIEGVELGRWGVPYVGGWRADDIYNTTKLKSVKRPTEINNAELTGIVVDKSGNPQVMYRNADKSPYKGIEKIDAGGLYCALIRADLYKNHEFHSENGLGPDVNFGLELRRTGHDNFIHWGVPCKHYNHVMGKEVIITPDDETKEVTITKKSETNWLVTY